MYVSLNAIRSYILVLKKLQDCGLAVVDMHIVSPSHAPQEASAAEEEGSEGKAARDDGRGTPASEEGSEGKKKKKKSKDKKPKEGNGEPEDGEEKKKKKKKKEKPADESLPPI